MVQIRDLDQTVIENPAHDLIRLGLSLASAARGSDLPGVTIARILEELVACYQNALLSNFETEKDKSHRPKSIQMNLARYLVGVVARAHGRQMKASQRRAWRSDLAKNHKASLEAPSWLWMSVVELLRLHEAAYLEHCRRFALSEAA